MFRRLKQLAIALLIVSAGAFLRFGQVLQAGDTFTQAEIHGGLIEFRHNDGSPAGAFNLGLTVTDKSGATTAPFNFTVNVKTPDEVQIGTNGQDNLFGGNGDSALTGLAGNDGLFGHGGDDCLRGGDGNDGLFAHGGDDVIHGGGDRDILNGGGGNDRTFGDDGNDVLFGAAGSDSLTGGSGRDVFLFNIGVSDADRVEDFDPTQDFVRFVNGGPADFAALVPMLQQVGFDTVIDFGGGTELTLAFTDASSLNATDFHFFS